MPKRMVMINTVCSGSHGRIMSDLQSALLARGEEAYVAFSRGRENASGRCIRIGNSWDIRLHGLASRLLDRHGFASRHATQQFVRELERLVPDAVHLHNLHGYYLHLETLFGALRDLGVPVIWTLHDCWAFTGHCSHYVRANCDRWKTRCGPCPLKGAYPASLLLDQSARNYDEKRKLLADFPNMTLVTPSRWLAAQVAESFLKDHPLRVIPNGVDLDRFCPPEHPKPNEKPMILAVAAPFDERKGYGDTLAVAKALPQYQFVLVGLTEKQIQALPEGVRGMTRTENAEALIELYRQADALLNTTYEDTYPTVNLEAMACGTPVVSYATGGCCEQIPRACGTLTPTGNVPRLTESVQQVVEAGKASYAQACRSHAIEHFDRRKNQEHYLLEYDTL